MIAMDAVGGHGHISTMVVATEMTKVAAAMATMTTQAAQTRRGGGILDLIPSLPRAHGAGSHDDRLGAHALVLHSHGLHAALLAALGAGHWC